jgi:hypothetical protein
MILEAVAPHDLDHWTVALLKKLYGAMSSGGPRIWPRLRPNTGGQIQAAKIQKLQPIV